MIRKAMAGAVLAGSAMMALVAWAQQKGERIDLDGMPFVVNEWGSNGGSVFAVSSPGDREPGVVVSLYTSPTEGTASFDVQWHSLLRNLAGSCAEDERLVRALALRAGYKISALKINRCKLRANSFHAKTDGIADIEKAARPAIAGGKCRADSYVGTWQRPGSGRQSAQVQIVFSREGQEGTGRATGFARAPYSDGEVIASRITGDGAGCRFKAQCGTITSTSNPCTVVVDPAQNRLTIEGGAKSFVSDVPWTRGTAAPAAAVCTRADIEGDWHRSDGALVPIVGVDAFARGDGGNALLYNHPENWPKGQSKFRGIYRVGGAQSCQLKAVCAGYDRNSRTGAVTRNERACELTIDPVRGTLRESGSTLTYRRDGRGGAATPAPAPVPEPKVSAEELAATRSLNADQAATAKREIERYEADKKRIADEQAANEAAYRKALADREALIAENDRKAREAMRKWEADVAACKAGDRSKCAPGPN